ncbi:GTP cyclohydrolase II (plasmid) [Bacillus thuringiensis serovar indiana]|nr:GTP cyclohydrolase II [Bacillus thuringiensis serovar indiana]
MITTATIHMLEDKIQFIHQDGKKIYLVGPIKLPINLYGETKIFQWYSWLQSNEVTDGIEGIIEKSPPYVL